MSATVNDIGDQISAKTSAVKKRAAATADNVADTAVAAASDLSETASAKARDFGDAVADSADDLKAGLGSTADDLKDRAAAHANDAREIVSNIANEARSKIAEIVDQQKSMGASKLSNLSRAAHNAAGDLDEQNPQVARLMRDAASTVDHFADDLRRTDLGDLVASVTDYARRQPVAFFAGSVLAGFVLARFLKSEPSARGAARS